MITSISSSPATTMIPIAAPVSINICLCKSQSNSNADKSSSFVTSSLSLYFAKLVRLVLTKCKVVKTANPTCYVQKAAIIL